MSHFFISPLWYATFSAFCAFCATKAVDNDDDLAFIFWIFCLAIAVGCATLLTFSMPIIAS